MEQMGSAGDDGLASQFRLRLAGLGELYGLHADRLRRLVAFRIDERLRGRIDPSDVIQDVFLEASARFDSYRLEPTMPEFLWLRFLALQRLAQLHRHHLGVAARDVNRELANGQVNLTSDELSEAIVNGLASQLTTPSQAAIRAEQCRRIHNVLLALEPIDREILILRHFEQLTNAEAARILALRRSAASNRYIRALQRLQIALEDDSGSSSCSGSNT